MKTKKRLIYYIDFMKHGKKSIKTAFQITIVEWWDPYRIFDVIKHSLSVLPALYVPLTTGSK